MVYRTDAYTIDIDLDYDISNGYAMLYKDYLQITPTNKVISKDEFKVIESNVKYALQQMQQGYIVELRAPDTNMDKFILSLRAAKEDMMPCSVQDVEKLQKQYGRNFPATYLKFLYTLGRGSSRYLMGSSVYYPELLELNKYAVELLATNGFKPLPENAFVFWMHQGYQFAFFTDWQSDDPPVYYYHEVNTKGDFEMRPSRLSDFFIQELWTIKGM